MSLEVFSFFGLAFSLGFEKKDLIFSPNLFPSSAAASELLGSMILIFKHSTKSFSVSNGVSISVALGSAFFLHSLFHHSSRLSKLSNPSGNISFSFSKDLPSLELIPNR